MTPIVSYDDVRLLTLIGVAIEAIEELALWSDVDPDKILAEKLYLTNKQVHEQGGDMFACKLATHYPILSKAIR